MLDFQRIVEEIQAAVLSPDTLDWDLLRDTAAEYAIACGEVNDRLTQCDRLLKQGLRSEAIQVADAEPNLIDAVAILDFPEHAEWRQLLAKGNMVLPPPIRIEVAAELNAAYATELPLQSLLKRHRMLALARAPLRNRIEVLREMRLADIMNPVWSDDLRVLEIARNQELGRSFDAAIKQRNLASATAMATELADPGWVHSPPPTFVEQAKGRRNALAATLAAEQLNLVEQELGTAYSAFDVKAGQEVRERWNSLQQVARLPHDHPLYKRAAPALHWLAEQDRSSERERSFAAACNALEFELEREGDRATLQRLFHAAQRCDEAIAPLLVRRYEERIRSLDAGTRRRFILATTAVVGVLVLIGVGTGWHFIRSHHEGLVAKAASAMGRLVSDGNVSEAQRYLDDLNVQQPVIAARPEIQVEAKRLQALQNAELARIESFNSLVARAEKAGLENPDYGAVSEANKIAVTTDEKDKVAALQAQISARDRQRQKERDEAFAVEFRQLLSQVEQIEADLELADSGFKNRIATLIAEAYAFQSRARGVSDGLTSQLRPIQLRLSSLNQQYLARKFEAEAIGQFATRVNRPAEYRDALEAFVKKFDNSPLSVPLKLAVEDYPLWEATNRWQVYLGDSRFKGLNQVTPEIAKEMLTQGDGLLAECGGVPLADEYRDRQEFLRSVAARIDDMGKSRVDGLQRLFDDPLVSGLAMVIADGRRYYLTAESNVRQVTPDGKTKIEYVADFDLSTRSVVVPKEKITQSGPSPQKQLVAAADGPMKKIRMGEWERGCYELLKLVVEQPDLDPVLRLILVRRVIETGRTGSHSLHIALKPLADQLSDSSLDLTANWLLPDDAPAQRVRLQAERALAPLAKLDDFGQHAAQLLRSEVAPLGLPTCIGWLRPRGKEEWVCQTSSDLPKTGDLLVLVTGDNDAAAGGKPRGRWERIGTCSDQGPLWKEETAAHRLAGRPVYWLEAHNALAAPRVPAEPVSSTKN